MSIEDFLLELDTYGPLESLSTLLRCLVREDIAGLPISPRVDCLIRPKAPLFCFLNSSIVVSYLELQSSFPSTHRRGSHC